MAEEAPEPEDKGDAACAGPEPEVPIPLTALQVPMTSLALVETFLRSGPVSVKVTSADAYVSQPFLRLATKMEGREENEVLARLVLPDPETVTDAQFMYISRLPRLLNQVHEKRAAPEGESDGILKSKVPPADVGHPPMYVWRTVKVFPES